MAGKKSDHIKTYIVIGLALVLAISGYFRFVHAKKGKQNADNNQSASSESSAAPVELEVPQIRVKNPENVQQDDSFVDEYLHVAVSDIFAPINVPPKPGEEPGGEDEPEVQEAPKLPPSLTLKGTIIGGQRPIAIINDRFVRMGDWIGQYQVVKIDKNEVHLSSDDNQLVLEVLDFLGK